MMLPWERRPKNSNHSAMASVIKRCIAMQLKASKLKRSFVRIGGIGEDYGGLQLSFLHRGNYVPLHGGSGSGKRNKSGWKDLWRRRKRVVGLPDLEKPPRYDSFEEMSNTSCHMVVESLERTPRLQPQPQPPPKQQSTTRMQKQQQQQQLRSASMASSEHKEEARQTLRPPETTCRKLADSPGTPRRKSAKISLRPILLLIHGFGVDAASWAPLLRHIDADLEVVAIDLPGHGDSPPPADLDETLSLVGMCRVIRDFVFSLRLHAFPGGVHIVGHSMGGALALAFADAHGAACNVNRLTLMAPAMTTPTPSPFMEAAKRGEFSKWLTPDNEEDMRRTLENIVYVDERTSGRRSGDEREGGSGGSRNLAVVFAKKALQFPGVVGAIHKAFMSEERRRFGDAIWQRFQTAFFDSDRHFGEFAAGDRLDGIDGLILWGQEDRIIDVSGAGKLKRWWPEWRVEVVEDAGHGFFVEKSKAVADILEEFSSPSSGQN